MKRLLFLAALPSALLGQAFGTVHPLSPDGITNVAAGVNFIGQIQTNCTNLVQTLSPTIYRFGLILAAASIILLVIKTGIAGMHWRRHESYMYICVVAAIRIMFMCLVFAWYLTPIIGPVKIYQVFPGIAQTLTNSINQDTLVNLLTNLNNAINQLPIPGMLEVFAAITYYAILALIILTTIAVNLITGGSYALLAVTTTVWPLFFWCIANEKHEHRFWKMMDYIIVYSSYRLIAAVFVSIFGGIYIDFFNNSVNGTWTIPVFLAALPLLALITASFVWLMFKIPDLSDRFFGGMGIGGGFIQGVARGGMSLASFMS